MPDLIINGIKIVVDIHVADHSWVKRTWQERLLSRPWRPLEKTKAVYDPKVYILEGGVALVSPQTYSILEREGLLKVGQIIGPILEVQKARRALTTGKL